MKTSPALILLCCLSCVFGPTSFVPTLFGQERGLVWSNPAYTYDDSGDIVQSLGFLDPILVQRRVNPDTFGVMREGRVSETIHSTHVLLLSDLEYLNANNTDEFLDVMLELRRAARLTRDGKRFPSVLVHLEVLKSLEKIFDPLPPVYAWVMASAAYEQYFADDKETAFRLLDGADQLLQQRSGEQHLHAAEIRNIRGLLLLQEEQPRVAIPLFKSAIEIAGRHRGALSGDVAVYQHNLALAFEANDRLPEAIAARQTALTIDYAVHPRSAIEIAQREAELAYLLLEDEQYKASIASHMKALDLYQRHHSQEAVEMTRIDFNIAYAYFAMKDFDRSQQKFDQLDFRPNKEASDEDRVLLQSLQKQTLNYLGTIALDKEQPKKALKHYLGAVKLCDKDAAETLDGHIHFNVAGRYQDLGSYSEARRWYQRAAAIYREVDGENSEDAADAEQQLTAIKDLPDTRVADAMVAEAESAEREARQMMLDRQRERDLELAERRENRTKKVPRRKRSAALAATAANGDFVDYSMHVKLHELMLVTSKSTRIMDGDKVVATVPAGTRLWSLEQRDSWHRVVVPGTARSAWVSNGDVSNLLLDKVLELSDEVSRRNAGNATANRLVQELNAEIPAALDSTTNRGLLESQTLVERVLEKFERVVDRDNFMAAVIRSRLAEIYFLNRQFVKVRRLLEEGLPSQRAGLGSDHPSVAVNLDRLATLLTTVGDYNGATACLQEALPIAVQRFGDKDPRTFGLQYRIADSLLKDGRLDDALKGFQQLLASADEQDNDPTIFLAAGHLGLGNVAAGQRKYVDAVNAFRRAVKEYSKLGAIYGGNHTDALLQLSKAHVLAGNVDEARVALETAEQTMRDLNVDSASIQAELVAFRTLVESRLGNYTEALKLVNRAMETAEQYYDSDSPNIRTGYAMRGRILAKLDRLNEAADEFDRARRISHSYVVNTMADQSVGRQIQFLKANDAALWHAALSLATVADSPQIREQSASWLLNSKNIANELAARDSLVRKVLNTAADVQNFEQWLDSRKRLAVLPKLTAEEKADQQLDQTEALLKQSAAESFAKLPAEARRQILKTRSDWVLCEDVRKKLKPHEVYIDILRMRRELGRDAKGRDFEMFDGVESYIAWIVPAAGQGDVSVVDLGEAEGIDRDVIQPILIELGNSLTKRKLIGEEAATAQVGQLTRKLTDVVWKPITAKLGDKVTMLTICPDSTLWKIPWAALPVEQDRFLIEDFTIRFVSSGRDLLQDNVRLAGLTQPIVMADPAYGASADELPVPSDLPSLRSFARQGDSRFDVRLLRDALPKNIVRLTGTADEAHDIQPFLAEYSGMTSKLLLQKEATEAAFRTVNRPHTLFIGTHGFFFPEADAVSGEDYVTTGTIQIDLPDNAIDSPLRRCGLLLAGCADVSTTNPESGIDGILTGEEVVAQDLRGTELVVLSACETGIGDLNNGQGVAGLRQAIQLAGARSVVSTLWSIEDQATTALISDFFAELAAGRTKSEALRAAQLSRIQQRRSQFGSAHPFYWGAFTVTGQD